MQRAVVEWSRPVAGSAAAEVPQVDHRVGQGLEGVVHCADALEPNQHASKLVLPSEHPFNRAEPLLEDGRIEQPLRPRLVVFLPRTFSLMFGVIPRLKMALRLA